MLKRAIVVAALTSIGCDQPTGSAGAAPAVVEPTSATEPAIPGVADVAVGPIPGGGPDTRASIANPFANDSRATRDGRRYFLAYNCAGCHGDHGGGGMGPSLRDATWLYGGSHAEIANSIAEGRANGMPAWSTRLTPTQIWQLTAYLKSLRTAREPEPPAGG